MAKSINKKKKLKGDSHLWQNGQTQGAVIGHALANTSFSSLSEQRVS